VFETGWHRCTRLIDVALTLIVEFNYLIVSWGELAGYRGQCSTWAARISRGLLPFLFVFLLVEYNNSILFLMGYSAFIRGVYTILLDLFLVGDTSCQVPLED
jgi:hypothetical protein